MAAMVIEKGSILAALPFYMMGIREWAVVWICPARGAGALKNMVPGILTASFTCFPGIRNTI